MKTLTWVALAVLPLLALAGTAQGDCGPNGCSTGYGGGYAGGCASGKCGGGYGYGYGPGGCANGACGNCAASIFNHFPITLGISNCVHNPPPWSRCCIRCGMGDNYNDCTGTVPGPWYLYWPDPAGGGIQTGPQISGKWAYENNFTGQIAPGIPGANPAGGYPSFPSYWYGR